MYRVVFYVVISAMILISKPVAAELTWGFKSPAFHHGNGYSSHVLSGEQRQHNRKQDLKDKADAEARRLERELENTIRTNLLRTLSPRIYATLSKQMVDSMSRLWKQLCKQWFPEIEGSQISWPRHYYRSNYAYCNRRRRKHNNYSNTGSGDFNF